MHYTVCTDFPANKLGCAKKLCITRIMHYDIMHYEKVYCTSSHSSRFYLSLPPLPLSQVLLSDPISPVQPKSLYSSDSVTKLTVIPIPPSQLVITLFVPLSPGWTASRVGKRAALSPTLLFLHSLHLTPSTSYTFSYL